jgi:hypothetical protein
MMFHRVNVIQILLHFLGCISLVWQVMEPFHYKRVWSIWAMSGYLNLLIYSLIPFLFEIGVFVLGSLYYKIRTVTLKTNQSDRIQVAKRRDLTQLNIR